MHDSTACRRQADEPLPHFRQVGQEERLLDRWREWRWAASSVPRSVQVQQHIHTRTRTHTGCTRHASPWADASKVRTYGYTCVRMRARACMHDCRKAIVLSRSFRHSRLGIGLLSWELLDRGGMSASLGHTHTHARTHAHSLSLTHTHTLPDVVVLLCASAFSPR